ncbi:hypothetical protein ALP93_200095 [Pseudomonas syringae pv. helianthi]|nr:hypothetical protein ALP93_200095 [Pseudomonas syringae pv. helianthi]
MQQFLCAQANLEIAVSLEFLVDELGEEIVIGRDLGST